MDPIFNSGSEETQNWSNLGVQYRYVVDPVLSIYLEISFK